MISQTCYSLFRPSRVLSFSFVRSIIIIIVVALQQQTDFFLSNVFATNVKNEETGSLKTTQRLFIKCRVAATVIVESFQQLREIRFLLILLLPFFFEFLLNFSTK